MKYVVVWNSVNPVYQPCVLRHALRIARQNFEFRCRHVPENRDWADGFVCRALVLIAIDGGGVGARQVAGKLVSGIAPHSVAAAKRNSDGFLL